VASHTYIWIYAAPQPLRLGFRLRFIRVSVRCRKQAQSLKKCSVYRVVALYRKYTRALTEFL
jgi:hypothetical protein